MAYTMSLIIMYALVSLWALIIVLFMILRVVLCFRMDSSNRDPEIGVSNYPIAEQGMQGPPLQKQLKEALRPIMVGTVVQYRPLFSTRMKKELNRVAPSVSYADNTLKRHIFMC
ncbi:hypothetical protein CXB51_024693 [Gossypium anomalum]|uniref:Uncharacterized protein n=1 Tax=Gossypium anomalum TaxID=47600 RepID=A0A8J5Z3R0_9ROSI|nr:hypothetical protein CXB51_024693 [Gossypium anomalum]